MSEFKGSRISPCVPVDKKGREVSMGDIDAFIFASFAVVRVCSPIEFSVLPSVTFPPCGLYSVHINDAAEYSHHYHYHAMSWLLSFHPYSFLFLSLYSDTESVSLSQVAVPVRKQICIYTGFILFALVYCSIVDLTQ